MKNPPCYHTKQNAYNKLWVDVLGNKQPDKLDRTGVASSAESAGVIEPYFNSIFTDHGSTDRLFSVLNLDFPGLEKVRSAYRAGDVDLAMDELLVYYKRRCGQWSVVSHAYTRQKSIDYADRACNNTLGNFGGATPPLTVQYGPGGINWTHNPFWETDADTEWVWGLHRQPFWLSLAWAYNETGKEVYAQAWIAQFESWLEQCRCNFLTYPHW